MIEQAYRDYAAELFAYAQKYVEANTAEDVVQKAFLDLMQCKEKVLKIRAFLYYRVIMNIFDNTKMQNNFNRMLQEVPLHRSEMPDERMIYAETLAGIKETITTLPEKNRRAVEAIIFNDSTYEEAAEECAISVDAVKASLKRAKSVLRGQMVE